MITHTLTKPDSSSSYFGIVRRDISFPRPRRFGKTLFLHILQPAFDHKREGEVILKDTDISKDAKYKWEKFPVLYFDFDFYGLIAV
jgi:hypothetical protein